MAGIIRSKEDPELMGVRVRDIETFNDGDVVNAVVTHALIMESSAMSHNYIDVGVDEGWWTAFCLATDASASIVAVEANPESAAALEERFRGEAVRIIPKGASDNDGVIHLTLEGSNSHSRGGGVEIECMRLSPLVRDLGHVRILKLDTEGHELRILRELRPVWDKIDAMIVEFTVYWYDMGEALEMMRDLLGVYPYIYILARRHNICLHGPITKDNYETYLAFLNANKIQVDIVASHREFPELCAGDII